MKKLINNAEDVSFEQLSGLAKAYQDLLDVHFDPHFVTIKEPLPARKVALLSGGGAGHEPLHVGYVGKGMLDAACPGPVFTSPTPDQMYEAGKIVAGEKGMLQIVKNYTGDVMNFQMAADMLRMEGIPVKNLVIDDDVAVKDSSFTAGRRGLGTTVIVEKVCGAAALAGYDLEQLFALGKKVNLRGKSMGMALTSCTTPQNGKPSFELGEQEMEIGIGIHGEPGIERRSLKSADEITAILTNNILDDGAYSRTLAQWCDEQQQWLDVELVDETFAAGDQVIAMVNGMGGTPESELYTVYGKLYDILQERGMSIVRSLVGNYITSIEMQGFSITLVKADQEILKFYDAPVHCATLRW